MHSPQSKWKTAKGGNAYFSDGMMGWTAPRTASACQDGRCRNPIRKEAVHGQAIQKLWSVTPQHFRERARREFDVHIQVGAAGSALDERQLNLNAI
jgi:hypothetical protein